MIGGIPETLEEALAPAWLSEALGCEVAAVAAGEVDNRVSTNVPIHLELAGGSPRDLWVKGYFSEIGRQFRHAGVPEAMFYRELAATTGIRTLVPAVALADLETAANVVITEDVLGAGATFLDARSAYTPDQAAASLEQLAALHAATWLDPRVEAAPWLAPRTGNYTIARGVTEIRENFEGPIGAGVPAEVRDPQRLYDAFKAVARAVPAATPWSVVHGDSHIGNVYLDGEGRPTFMDWQLVQRGPWYLDVGYHLASALSIEDRRRHEDDLVAHYLDRLAAGGVEVPGADDVRRGLRRGVIHGFYLWGITLKVDPEITRILLERLGTAAADHDAYTEVEA